MLQFTQADYNKEIAKLANWIIEDLAGEPNPEDHFYDRVCEVVDGHNWIISYSYNLSVLACSSNPNAAFDDFGLMVGHEDYQTLIQGLAYWAMTTDLRDELHNMQSNNEENN
jgi:hypothetical protein